MELVSAVCFDAFGTLCGMSDRRGVYRTLIARSGLDPAAATRRAMTEPLSLPELALAFGCPKAAEELRPDLEAELASIAPYEDALETLDALSAAGLLIWIATNLAAPYGPPLRKLFAGRTSGFTLSCEIDAVKPESAVFARVCAGLSLPPEAVLMIGDSPRSDVAGAEAFGMQALLLRRGAAEASADSVRSLRELVERLDLPRNRGETTR